MSFQKAVDFTLPQEGLLSMDEDDRGGLTKFGISQATYPDLDIAKLTYKEALKIYEKDYWFFCRCHVMPASLGICVFDVAVNHGGMAAGLLLQTSINAILGEDYLLEDSIIGSRTLAAMAKCNTYRLCSKLLGLRLLYYDDIIDEDEDQEKFFEGWVNRTADLLMYI